ncbi:MAG: hypothetical protein IPN95_19110 [Bacteroidetes bacterium]|nr:hypothetical protein [Bacteroidota bacterium]
MSILPINFVKFSILKVFSGFILLHFVVFSFRMPFASLPNAAKIAHHSYP